MDYGKIGDAVMRILARTFQELLVNVTDTQGEMKPKNSLGELLQENYSRELTWEYPGTKKQLSIRECYSYAQKMYLQNNPCHAQVILLHEIFEQKQERELVNDAKLDIPQNKVGAIAVLNLDQNAQINILDILDLSSNNKPLDGKYSMEGVNLLCSLFEKFSDEEFKEKMREELGEYDLDKILFEDAKREVKIEMVNKLLVAKFSELPSDYVKKLHSVSMEKLDSIITNAFRLKSLNDLDQYL